MKIHGKGFVQCKCHQWAYIPEGFDERKHFVYHVPCNQAMYLNRLHDPLKDLGLPVLNLTTEIKLGPIF